MSMINQILINLHVYLSWNVDTRYIELLLKGIFSCVDFIFS